MATSPLFGAERAPEIPSGKDNDALGPSDTVDSGSDVVGSRAVAGDSDTDSVGTGERPAAEPGSARQNQDIAPDRISEDPAIDTDEDRPPPRSTVARQRREH